MSATDGAMDSVCANATRCGGASVCVEDVASLLCGGASVCVDDVASNLRGAAAVCVDDVLNGF